MLDTGYLTEFAAPQVVSGYTAAGTNPITSSGVDMEGWDGVEFSALLSVANDNNYLTAGHADADSGYVPTVAKTISGTSPSNEGVVLDILHPQKRWVNCIMTLGTSSAIYTIWARRYRARNAPVVVAVPGTLALAQFNAPATL
jgi:hypothetical protein